MSDFSPFNTRQIYPTKSFEDPFIRYRTKGKPLTYLVGAKCRDGIIIVSDSRLIAEYDVENGNKILPLGENIVVGAAGHTRFFKQFLNELNDRLQDKPSKSLKETRILAEDIIFSLYQQYAERTKMVRGVSDGIECFIAIKDIWKRYNIHTNNVKLYALGVDGSALPITDIKALGHAEPYGAMFLRLLWNETYSMRQTAELVAFVINVVYTLGLDVTVDHRLQYFCIPYKGNPEFMPPKDMDMINNNVKKMVEIFNDSISQIRNMMFANTRKELDEEIKNHTYEGDCFIDDSDIDNVKGLKKEKA